MHSPGTYHVISLQHYCTHILSRLNRIDWIKSLGPDDICQRWRENKCFELKWDPTRGHFYCGRNDVHRPHHNIRWDWDFRTITSFAFTISASERLNRAIQQFGKVDPVDNKSYWTIPAVADEKLTTVGQIHDFACKRLVSKQQSAC